MSILDSLDFFQHLIILSLYIVSILTLNLLMLSSNGFCLSNYCSAIALIKSSVLGSTLFSMYTKPLSTIIDSHSIIHHSFADDLQLQVSAPDKIFELLHFVQSCEGCFIKFGIISQAVV